MVKADRTTNAVRKLARKRANHRIAFAGHAVVYLATNCLLAVVFFPAAVIVSLAWGIGLAAHGFFGVVAPLLRERWTDEEMARVLPMVRRHERRVSDDRHARDVEKLAASLAHEIRNPIAAAKSLVQQIAEDPTSPDTAEYARVAGSELDRVETSIAHLLRFAKEEPVVLDRVELARVVESAIDAVGDRGAHVRIERDLPALALDADEDKLRRVLLNLVGNAADAVRDLPEERRVVHVEAGRSFDGSEVWLRVRDHGHGIDAELRERIFEPWITTKVDGTGLGMAIARKLVEAHGGTLELEKTGATGTSMLVTLPREVVP